MTAPWNLTEPQRRQLREAQAAAKRRRVQSTILGTEPCPDCGVPMVIEDGLWYCAREDAYHGEAEEDDDDE